MICFHSFSKDAVESVFFLLTTVILPVQCLYLCQAHAMIKKKKKTPNRLCQGRLGAKNIATYK